ncbi:FixH family protein [Paraglaciecola sp. Hal342]
MILSFNMLRFAFDGQDAMVVDDYYKQGKAINISLEKIQAAKARNIETQLIVNEQDISLRFINGTPETGAALRLAFYHVTQAPKDQTVDLFRDAQGIYRGSTEHDLTGKWQVALTPTITNGKYSKRFLFQMQTQLFLTLNDKYYTLLPLRFTCCRWR